MIIAEAAAVAPDSAVAAGLAKKDDRGETTTATLGDDGRRASAAAAAGEAFPFWRSFLRRPLFPTASASAAAALLFGPPKKHLPKTTAPPPPPDPSSPSTSSPLSIPHETKLQLLQESEEKRGPQLNLREEQPKKADERGGREGRKTPAGEGKHCCCSGEENAEAAADEAKFAERSSVPRGALPSKILAARAKKVQKMTL